MALNFLNMGAPEMALFILPIMAVEIYALYQCLTNLQLSSSQRILWLIVILAVPIFGCLGYLLAFRNVRAKSSVKK